MFKILPTCPSGAENMNLASLLSFLSSSFRKLQCENPDLEFFEFSLFCPHKIWRQKFEKNEILWKQLKKIVKGRDLKTKSKKQMKYVEKIGKACAESGRCVCGWRQWSGKNLNKKIREKRKLFFGSCGKVWAVGGALKFWRKNLMKKWKKMELLQNQK